MPSTTSSRSSRSASSRRSSRRSCSAPTAATACSRSTRRGRSPPTDYVGGPLDRVPHRRRRAWPVSPRRCCSPGTRSTRRARARGWRDNWDVVPRFLLAGRRARRRPHDAGAAHGVLHHAPRLRVDRHAGGALRRLGGRRDRRGELRRAGLGRALARRPAAGAGRHGALDLRRRRSTTGPCRDASPPLWLGPDRGAGRVAAAAHDAGWCAGERAPGQPTSPSTGCRGGSGVSSP